MRHALHQPKHPVALRRRRYQSGQSTLEYVLTAGTLFLPMSFMVIFTAQLLWTWHSAVEWTREGARYASTHCWQGNGENVRAFMRRNVPVHMDQQEFSTGTAEIAVLYYRRNPDSGALEEFTCDGGSECSTECIPDALTVQVTGYEFRHFMGAIGLPPVTMPNFQTSLPVESAGCDAEQQVCEP